MIGAVLLLWACGGAEPVPLPEKAWAPPKVEGRMASNGTVRGYVARPVAEDPPQGLLQVVPGLDDAARAAARTAAEGGAVVLVVDGDQDVAAAHRWLLGMRGVQRATCTPGPCP